MAEKETKKVAAKPKAATATPAKTNAPSATSVKPKAAVKTAPEKEKSPKKPRTEKSVGESEKAGVGARVAAAVKTDRFRMISILVLSALFVACVCVGLVLGFYNRGATFVNAYRNMTLVGYSAKVIDTVDRVKPVEEMGNEGLDELYPTFGYTKNLTTEQKTAVISESIYLTANGTWRDVSHTTTGSYDKMDADGYLYTKDGTPVYDADGNPRRLYQHTASVGMYLGNVSDEEPAVTKNFTFRPRSYSKYYNITGLYAPAGEVIKIQISEADMNATAGITIHIGQALYNGQANNIWEARNVNRMPVILNTMVVTKETATLENGVYTAYVGSYLGGPIYVRAETVTFSVSISGGVNYPHFILGVTTEDEYNEYLKSSAPYFDLEVWDSGVLHSGPRAYAAAFDYDDLYKAAVLWEKISLVSSRVVNQGVVFLYDPFVAAGAAVAFPGRCSVNCPMGWMSSSLNYNAFVTSGSWGNVHEYHHNFQNFGVGYTGEVTNNALNLVSYSLFTKISSARQLSSYGGAGLSGWNCYTSATWVLNRVNTGQIGSTNGLAVYGTLLHNLGQDAFINSTNASGANYFNKWAQVTHQDFTYFASQITAYTGTLIVPAETDYPVFVPVSSVYQTGRSYMYDNEKRYIETMQPFVIPYGQSYTVDLNPYTVNKDGQYVSGSVVIGNGFQYKIKSVQAKGINGKFVKSGDGIYTFTPNSQLRSGKIYVTLEITTEDGEQTYDGKPLNDVELVLEFEQTHEAKKAILERTVYTYKEGAAYTDAIEAYEKGFAGYISKEEEDNLNPTQNSNTDVWLYPDTEANRADEQKLPYIANSNQIYEISGKLYFPEAGRYRIYLRGRTNCALYISTDNGEHYKQAAYIDATVNPGNSANFLTSDERVYYDIDVEAETWIYFKEVLIVSTISNGMASYVGIGIGSWTVPQYTTTTETDANGNVITHYWNSEGHEVPAEEASNVTPVPPTGATYVSGYRQSYEFTKEFTSEYFYTRSYNYNYNDTVIYSGKPTLVSVSHDPWDSTRVIDYLLDGSTGTSYHSQSGVYISEEKPFELIVDLGETFTANHVTFYGYHQNNPIGNLGIPVTFTLYGSLDGEEFFELFSRANMEYDNKVITFDFEKTNLRYYKLYVTLTDNGKYFAMSEILFFYNTVTLTGNGSNFYSPESEMFAYSGNWRVETASASFGHVYVGTKGAQVRFTFEGTRLMILSSNFFGKNFEVYIDGKLVKSVDLRAATGDYAVSYLSSELSGGKHTVVIKCVGEANIDSFVFY